jgi:gamma-glutamyltranspeptidase/glutathione hydrolase
MERREFLAAVPAAAIGLSLAGSAGAQTEAEQIPAFQPPGTDRWERLDVQAGDRPVGASFASRSEVFGRSGAAGTSHPLATLAGIDILRNGGSAVDAAIAINACLGFLEPTACGIGGDGYAMLWDPKAAKVVGIAG